MQIIAFLFHFPPMSGGGPVVSYNIVNTMATLGHHITVLVPDTAWKDKKYEPQIHENIKIVRVDTPSRDNLKLAARRCVRNLQKMGEKLCKETEFDLIFTIFHPFHLVPNAAVSCGKKFNKPVVIKVDDAVYEKSSGLKSIQRSIEKRFSTKALKGATEILVLNEQTMELVSSFYNVSKEKISIMPNGIDLSFFDIRPQRENKIVFSGVMYYHRGLDVLLEVVPKIVQVVPDVKIVLIGEGPELNRLQSIVSEKKISENVEFKGWVDRTEIPRYLASAVMGIGPLQLTPLTAKSIPVKVLEYMASSLPIVSKKGSLSDDVLVHGENGYLIEDAHDLAEKIINLLQNPSLVEKMGTASRKMVQKFAWENLISKLLEKYIKS